MEETMRKTVTVIVIVVLLIFGFRLYKKITTKVPPVLFIKVYVLLPLFVVTPVTYTS